MATRIFKKDFLVDELDLPYNDDIIKLNEIVDTSRWSIVYKIVFEYEGKFYSTSYGVGATESQDEGPWEHLDEVQCMEVEEKEVTVKRWVAIQEYNYER